MEMVSIFCPYTNVEIDKIANANSFLISLFFIITANDPEYWHLAVFGSKTAGMHVSQPVRRACVSGSVFDFHKVACSIIRATNW